MFQDRSRWWGWGDPEVRTPLSARPELDAYLTERLLLKGASGLPVPELAQVQLPAAGLDDESRRALESALSGAALDSSHEGRVRHAAGKSYIDLVRLRQGKLEAAPDAVAHPTSREQVEAVLAVAAQRGIAVVPFGGGTSVVGGVHPGRAKGSRAVVTLDLRSMARVLDVQPRSWSATVEAGILGPALESQLEKRGLTLGHFPQSFEFSTLGGWIAARSAGQCSSGYGRIDEMVHALEIVSPGKRFLTAPPVPAATGPSLRDLFVGSEGVLGVITSATVRVRPIPERRRLTSAFFASFQDGLEAARELAQDGPKPTMIRLSDPQETELLLTGAPRPHGLFGKLKRDLGLWIVGRRAGGTPTCVMIMDFEGARASTKVARKQAEGKLARRSLLVAGEGPARSWFTERFRHPYLRDELLGRGVMVETLETATTWHRLTELYAGVRGALERAVDAGGVPGLVLCHLSHTYTQGASLYFTVMARALPGQEIAQWQAVKTAASDEIARQNAALSHHHGVGADHARWMEAQHGANGVALLAALKRELDPAGILNPGKVLPEGAR